MENLVYLLMRLCDNNLLYKKENNKEVSYNIFGAFSLLF